MKKAAALASILSIAIANLLVLMLIIPRWVNGTEEVTPYRIGCAVFSAVMWFICLTLFIKDWREK